MTQTKIYVRNLGANWIGYIIMLIVLFFLSPFVIHSLGNTAYGVWCLLVSLTGYMGLLDVGIMVSTSRYINLYIARNDQQNINRVVSASFFFYIGISIVLFTVATIIGPFLGEIFASIPRTLITQARWILYLFCANILFGFISALLRQLLASKNRFDLQNVAVLAVLTISTTGTVWVLKAGYGLVALAIVQVTSSLLGCVILFYLAKLYGPRFKIRPIFVRKETLLELFSFGIFAFIADIGTQLIFYTDSIVIGLFIGPTAITFYNIGLMLVEYGRNLVKEARNVMTPDVLKCAGGGSLSENRWLLVKNTRFLMVFSVPLLVGLATLGKEFIFLWMGPGYEESAIVLMILAVSQFGVLASLSCSTTLIGMGRVKFLALITVVEGIINLCLTIIFVNIFHWGIRGVALGTLIPMAILTSLALPLYTCRLLVMRIYEFAKLTFLRWIIAAIVFAVPCMVAGRLPIPQSWPLFAAKMFALGVIYIPIAFYLLLTKGEKNLLLGYLRKGIKLRPVIGR